MENRKRIIHTGIPPDLIHQTLDLQMAFYRLGHILYTSPEWPMLAYPDFSFLIETQLFHWSPAGLFHEPVPNDWQIRRDIGIPLAVWVHDPFLNFDKQIAVTQEADMSFISQKPWMQNFAGYCKRMVWVNAAALSRDLTIPYSELPKPTYDVGFVGAVSHPYYQERKNLLGKIKEKGLSVFIHDSSTQPPLYRQDMIRALSKCKIIFNYIRPDMAGTGNARVFETMMAGRMLLTNNAAGISELGFASGDHFMRYESEKECVELANYFSYANVERESIAKVGQEYCLEHHSWESRAKAILDAMEPLLK